MWTDEKIRLSRFKSIYLVRAQRWFAGTSKNKKIVVKVYLILT
jgi:hypothetical protein